MNLRIWVLACALFAPAGFCVDVPPPPAWKKLRVSGPLPSRLAQLIKKGPRAQIGVHVYDLKRNRLVYQNAADRYYLPASNSKLLTTSLALTRLGPDHTLVTRVLADAAPGPNGVLAGDLILAGGGDPSLTLTGASDVEPVPAIAALADQVVAAGVKRVRGSVVGDDTAWPWIPYGEGWTIDDAIWDYGAPVSALSLHGNRVSVRIVPGAEAGAGAGLMVFPALEYLTFDNRVVTTAGRRAEIRIDRPQGSRTVVLRGTIGVEHPGTTERVALDDPALAAAHSFATALQARGVVIDGAVEARHRDVEEPKRSLPGLELARHVSPPMGELLKIVNKFSQNLSAEMVLREVALQKRGEASPQNGLAELEALLVEAGVAKEEFRVEDGSGLSRRTVITPRALTALLAHLYRSEHRDLFRDLLPVAGEAGTLRNRFGNVPARDQAKAKRISAKTGSLATAIALSGYADSPRGPLAFSILVNNFNEKSADVRDFIDRLALELTR